MNAYENADRYFALWQSTSRKGGPEPCTLSCTVRELYRAHADGLVETVEGLPDPEAVFGLSQHGLQSLAVDIESRYFPDDRAFRETRTYLYPANIRAAQK